MIASLQGGLYPRTMGKTVSHAGMASGEGLLMHVCLKTPFSTWLVLGGRQGQGVTKNSTKDNLGRTKASEGVRAFPVEE